MKCPYNTSQTSKLSLILHTFSIIGLVISLFILYFLNFLFFLFVYANRIMWEIQIFARD